MVRIDGLINSASVESVHEFMAYDETWNVIDTVVKY